MDLTALLTLLLAISILTSLTIQGIKSVVSEERWERIPTNVVTALVAVILSAVLPSMYIIYVGGEFNRRTCVEMIALMYLSFLVATNGYDKIVQAVKQIKGGNVR